MASATFARGALSAALVVMGLASVGSLEPAMAQNSRPRCTIQGTAKADKLRGTRRRDVICGGSGRDRIYGMGGNDVLIGGPGSDTINGGNGNDTISGDAGSDSLVGGIGADSMSGGSGTDTVSYAERSVPVTVNLDGHAGDGAARENDALGSDIENAIGGSAADSLTGDAEDNSLFGGPGDDAIDGGNGNDTLTGGDGNDSIAGATGTDSISGGAGNDTVSYAERSVPVTVNLDGHAGDGAARENDALGSDIENAIGGSAADSLTGDAGDNSLFGGPGDDAIDGGNGNDTLTGGDGNDSIAGATGTDSISGDAGNDVLRGDSGRDTMSGGSGDDALAGGGGDDHLEVGPGTSDEVDGGQDKDSCTASDGQLEEAPNCEVDDGWGVYGRVTLAPQSSDGAVLPVVGYGVSTAHVAPLSNGDLIVLTAVNRQAVMTKLDARGNVDLSFGSGGWVSDLTAGRSTYPDAMWLVVVEDQVYVLFGGGLLVKYHADGTRDASFGDAGFLDLATACTPVTCERSDRMRELSGWYRPRLVAGHLEIGFNYMTSSQPYTFLTGVVTVTTTGTIEHLIVFPGETANHRIYDVLAMPESHRTLRMARNGDVYAFTDMGGVDSSFGTAGVVSAGAVSPLTGDPDRGRAELVDTTTGWARITVTGTLKPADNTGVPKLDEFEPQHLLVESYDQDGQPTQLDTLPAISSAPLPAESERCDPPAAGSTGANTYGMPTLTATDLIPVDRCSDGLWVSFNQAGVGTTTRKPGGNIARRVDWAHVPAGDVLAYPTASGRIALDIQAAA